MDYSQIILELLERIKALENKVKALEDKIKNAAISRPPSNMQLERVSVKYRGLAEYLLSTNATKVILSYAQIEELLGFPLPETAHRFKKSYWANTERHSYASSWMAIGYKARVDIVNNVVTFTKNLA